MLAVNSAIVDIFEVSKVSTLFSAGGENLLCKISEGAKRIEVSFASTQFAQRISPKTPLEHWREDRPRMLCHGERQ